MVLGGSDGCFVFGRPVHHRHVLMLVLGNGDGSLLPQNVRQGSERQSRRVRGKTGTDVLPLSSPNKPQKVFLNDLASIWISLEHNGEEILITPESRGDLNCVLNNVETKALMSAGLQSNLISVGSLKPPNESNISPAAPTFGAALTENTTGDQRAESVSVSGRVPFNKSV